MCVCVCVCVYAISHCTFLYLQYIYLYQTCVLKSEFGHVWILTSLVYLLKLLYVNYCVVGCRMAQNLFYFVHCMCLYIFLQLFVRRIVPQILLGVMRHRNVHCYYYSPWIHSTVTIDTLHSH